MDHCPSLFDAPAVSETANDVSVDIFWCCSRYRECSSAGGCVISDQAHSVNCSYRKNLERGRVFFGKRANDFSLPEYQALRADVETLSPPARAALDALLIEFCEYHRGARVSVVRSAHLDELSDLALFEFSPLGSRFPSLCGYKALKERIEENSHIASAFRAACERRKDERKPLEAARQQAKQEGDRKEFRRLEQLLKDELCGANTIKFLHWWLNECATELRDELAAPYRLARPLPDAALYIEELYQDTLRPSYDRRVYPLSPLAEDRFLNLPEIEAEEARRKAFSRG